MSSLVSFDQKGAFGPAMCLIHNIRYHNANGICDLVLLVKANFEQLSKMSVSGDSEFNKTAIERNLNQCPLSPTEVIATRFFKSMQKEETNFGRRRNVLEKVVPHMLKSAKSYIPGLDVENLELKAWTAGFVECLMTDEQIQKICDTQNANNADQFLQERIKIGKELYQAAIEKEVTEKDLDHLIGITRVALQSLRSADHYQRCLNLSGRYLILFSMHANNPQEAGEEVLGLLATVFRKKMFEKQMEDSAVLENKAV